jgi:hypothetical protein
VQVSHEQAPFPQPPMMIDLIEVGLVGKRVVVVGEV